MTTNQIDKTEAVRHVAERMDLGDVTVPSLSTLKKLNQKRRQKRQVVLAAAGLIIVGASYLGATSLTSSTTELTVAGTDETSSTTEPAITDTSLAALEGLLDPSDSRAETETPRPGDTAAEAIKLNPECRNGGTVEAFGFVWRMVELAPLQWRDSESLNGEIHFESLEKSTFTVENETVVVSNTMVVGDECTLWP